MRKPPGYWKNIENVFVEVQLASCKLALDDLFARACEGFESFFFDVERKDEVFDLEKIVKSRDSLLGCEEFDKLASEKSLRDGGYANILRMIKKYHGNYGNFRKEFEKMVEDRTVFRSGLVSDIEHYWANGRNVELKDFFEHDFLLKYVIENWNRFKEKSYDFTHSEDIAPGLVELGAAYDGLKTFVEEKVERNVVQNVFECFHYARMYSQMHSLAISGPWDEYEKDVMLFTLRDELYNGSWVEMRADMKKRLSSKTYTAEFVNGVEEDLVRVERLEEAEKEGSLGYRVGAARLVQEYKRELKKPKQLEAEE